MGAEKLNESPSVFEYEDYRVFLGETYAYLKLTMPQFSYRYFSSKAGVSSPNFLKLVIEGKRNLSSKMALQFAKALKLSSAETKFFCSLVAFSQAKNQMQKSKAAKQLLKAQTVRRLHPLKQSELRYYAHWFYIPIREMVVLYDFKEDPVWIGNHLRPRISAEQAAMALNDLLNMGMLTRDEEGKLVQAHASVTTESEVASTLVRQFHKEMMDLGNQSIERFHREHREISATCFSVDSQSIPKLKTLIREFRKELLALSENCDQANSVMQLNIQMFPMLLGEEGDGE